MPVQSGPAEAVTTTRSRLLWLIGIRAVVATVLFGTAILFRIGQGAAGSQADAYFVLIAVTYALTGAYAATLRFADRHRWLVDLQFAGDIALVSVLVFLSGGVGSYFPSLYGLPIVAAGTLQRRRGGLLAGTLSAACYATVIAGQYSGALPATTADVALPAWHEGVYRVAMNGAGFLAVGWLTGSLAEGWRVADERLASASSAMADLQALTRCIMDSLPGGVLTTDEQGRVLAVNRAATIITGRSTAELLGADVSHALELPADAAIHLEGPDARKLEFEYMKPSGQRIVLGLGAVPLMAESETRGLVFTFQDVTESKRREYEAERQKRLAAIGEMAAGIAHEIRNPLASMAGSMQLLRAELALSGEQAQLMDIVLRESGRLNEIIRNFLAYARPQRGASRRVDVRRMVEDTTALLRNSPDCRADHVLQTVVDDRPVVCEADEAQLRQVVWNLASNALRAMPQGGTLAFRVERGTAGAHPVATIAVEDTGVGMTREQQERLFQPFQSGFAQGTGLGLAIAHRIVADHHGTITASSAVGRGTVITVRLPLAAEQARSGEGTDSAAHVSAA